MAPEPRVKQFPAQFPKTKITLTAGFTEYTSKQATYKIIISTTLVMM